ncbi:MAG: peptide chain release factor N(5)-glutamine methyltransferase, partial [Cellvibrionaceae bacterium]|nr:peptide chain release factor N(5)-glutamine methyltransferase [Cellvibrionaceae bacterium]
GQNRTYLFTWPEREPSAEQLQAYRTLLARRQLGEPVAHILGRREFWDLDLAVNPSTLIPRADTEALVELALNIYPEPPARVLDLGTGSGAIALALARSWPAAEVVGTDLSEAALALAAANGQRNGVANVRWCHSAWFAELSDAGLFELIVSNPPYIDAEDPHLSEGDVRFEPHSALVAADQGLADLAEISAAAPHFLSPGGWLLLEHGYQQGQAVRALLQAAGFTEVASHRDLAGRERISAGRWQGVKE